MAAQYIRIDTTNDVMIVDVRSIHLWTYDQQTHLLRLATIVPGAGLTEIARSPDFPQDSFDQLVQLLDLATLP